MADHKQTTWRICVFKSFRLERDGEKVYEFQNRRQEALLAYLALDPHRARNRKEVAALFWPGKSESLRLNRLSEVLVHLRRLLKELGVPNDAVVTGGGLLRLNEEISSDIVDFDRLLTAVWDAEGVDSRRELRDRLKDLFGSGLLPGLRVDWAEQERRRYHSLYVEAMRELRAASEVMRAVGAPARVTVGPTPDGPGSMAPEPYSEGPVREEPSRSFGIARADKRAQDLVALLLEAEGHLFGPERRQWMERIGEYQEDAFRVVELALDRGDYITAAAVLGHVWPVWLQQVAPTEGRGRLLFERALIGLPPANDEIYGRLVHGAGVLSLRLGDLYQAEARLMQSAAIWESRKNKEWYARAIGSLGLLAKQADDLETASVRILESLTLIRSVDKPGLLANHLHHAARVEIERGRLGHAKTYLIEAIALARAFSDDHQLGIALMELGSVFMRLDEWDQALEAVSEGMIAHSASGDRYYIAAGLRQYGYLLYRKGEYKAALEQLLESESVFREANDMREVGHTMHISACALEEDTQFEQALEKYRTSVGLLTAAGDHKLAAEVLQALMELEARLR